MPRRMADQKFRDEQWRRRKAKHIAPINRLVDALRRQGANARSVPYVAPMYGGIHARLLSVLRDPGPKTQPKDGSGFLSMENDDATAEMLSQLFEAAGIKASDVVPWNVYPYFINRNPTPSELEMGVPPLKRIIDLMPKLRVVMLHGQSARDGWRRLVKAYPTLVADRALEVIATYHTSRQAFRHPNAYVREARKKHLADAFMQAARLLGKGSA
jgi:hypothetical protein